MKTAASSLVRATLIGDVVGSRTVRDRAGVHRALDRALREVAGAAVDPPAFTVGDEFQGAFTGVGRAIDAALAIRLAVAPGIDVRFGIGWGAITMLDESAGIQDGPGWWAAREAIEWTASARGQRRSDMSGPPAWIVGRPIDTDCAGTVEHPNQE